MIEIINNLSFSLSKEINLSPSASSGLIRLAIKDEFGPYKPIEQLDLNDYITICERALRKRLEKLEINDIDQIVVRIRSELIQFQSLITF